MNKADEQRVKQFHKIGCLACLIDGKQNPQYDVHHVLSGGRRIGDQATVPLCPWHHRGVFAEASSEIARAAHGPSLALHPRQFTERYGSQQRLLEMTNELLVSQ